MQENTKRDPVIRTLVIIIVGTIAFNLLFGLFKGGGTMNMDNMHQIGMGNSSGIFGTSLDGFLSGLLMLMVKLLIVVLVVAALFAIGLWVKKTFFKDSNGKLMQTLNNDPILKTAVIAVAAILGLILLLGLFGSFANTGAGYGMNGFNASLSFAGLLTLLIKVMSISLVVSLVMALAAYVKKLYDERNIGAAKAEETGKATDNNASAHNTNTDSQT